MEINVHPDRQQVTTPRTSRRPRCYAFQAAFAFLCIAAALASCATGMRKAEWRVAPINETALRKILLKNRGQVVLLNFWATWCEPCVAEFPDLVRLAHEKADRLVVISVTIDIEEDVPSKVIPFLQKQAAPFSAYIKRAPDDEAFINDIDPQWSGAIPATFIFRPDGTLAQRLVGQQSFDKFAQAIQAAETPPAVLLRQEGTLK